MQPRGDVVDQHKLLIPATPLSTASRFKFESQQQCIQETRHFQPHESRGDACDEASEYHKGTISQTCIWYRKETVTWTYSRKAFIESVAVLLTPLLVVVSHNT